MPTTSTQTNVPWAPMHPFILAGANRAKNLLNSGAGFQAPSFQTYVPFSQQTQGSLGWIQDIAHRGNPLAGRSMGAISSILGGNQNARYRNLFQQSGNPYFEKAVQGQSDKIAADVQRQFGGLGRIGSAADTGALTQQIGDFRSQALSNNWNQNIANQRGILGDWTGAQLNAVGAAPGAYQQQFLPAERLGQVGAAREDLAKRALDARINKFNTNQQAPFNQLQYYNQQIGATGGTSPGFNQQTVAQPTNWLGILSGAAAAASPFFAGGGGGGGGIWDYFSGRG